MMWLAKVTASTWWNLNTLTRSSGSIKNVLVGRLTFNGPTTKRREYMVAPKPSEINNNNNQKKKLNNIPDTKNQNIATSTTTNMIKNKIENNNNNNDKNNEVIVHLRKPKVEEEIAKFKYISLRKLFVFLLGGILCKLLYDGYCNYLQKSLYEDEEAPQVLWKQVGNNAFLEAFNSRTVRQRYGKGFKLAGDPSVTKQIQIRYWLTVDYIEDGKFLLRLRNRIWEDIGRIQVSVPVQGDSRTGVLHIKAYTRDNRWILQRAWLEDDSMMIELQRRIDLDMIINTSNTIHNFKT